MFLVLETLDQPKSAFVKLMDTKLQAIAMDLKIAAEYAKLHRTLKLKMPNVSLEKFSDIQMAEKLSRKLKSDLTVSTWNYLKPGLIEDFKIFHDFYRKFVIGF